MAEHPELNHVYFMLLKTTSDWLQLPTTKRFEFIDETIKPILAKHRSVKMRFFDSEAFSGRFTDVIMWETANVAAYQALVEHLREATFWGAYFEVVEIVPAIENAYAIFNNVEPIAV